MPQANDTIQVENANATAREFQNAQTLGGTAVTNDIINFTLSSRYPFTIIDFKCQTTSGSITGTFRKNGVSIGGATGVTINSSLSTVTPSSTTIVGSNDKLDFIVTGSTSGVNAACQLDGRRNS